MAPPFVNSTPTWLYILVGSLVTLVVVTTLYIIYLHRRKLTSGSQLKADQEDKNEDLRTDNIGLSKKAEDLLNEVMEDSGLQNELPDRLDVSKATVSNAVSELKDRGLILRKKKANTYLIEPDIEELEKQQR
jgi:uncharacterized membrane protein